MFLKGKLGCMPRYQFPQNDKTAEFVSATQPFENSHFNQG
jgi:hypothetical protein